jgi:hypothetical protein
LSAPSGLGGLASRIVDAMGGLLGSAVDPLTDPSNFDDRTMNPFDEDADDEDADDDQDADDKPDVKADDPDEAQEAQEAEEPEEPALAEAAAPGNAPPGDVLPPGDVPPTGAAVPQVNGSPADASNGSTPCEIAADELPQAGQ